MQAGDDPRPVPGHATGQRFERQIATHTVVVSIASALLLCGYVVPNFRLTDEQTDGILALVGIMILLISPAAILVYRRICRPVAIWIDEEQAGSADALRCETAFAAILSLPIRITVACLSMWIACGGILCVGLALGYDELGGHTIFTLFAAILGSALVAQVFGYVKLRWDLQPLREHLTGSISDPERRAALVMRFPLAWKLTAATVSLVGAAVVMSVAMSQVQSRREVASLVARIQGESLEEVVTRVKQGVTPARAAAQVAPFFTSTVADLRVVNPSLSFEASGLEGILHPAEWRVIQASGGTRGSSVGVDMPHAFAWVPVPGSGLLAIASIPHEALSTASVGNHALFFGLILIWSLLGMGIGHLVGADAGSMTARLREQAHAIAQGDLRRGVTVESEDELGDLARSLDGMASALRGTLGAAAEAADQLESTAEEMASTSNQVTGIAKTQQAGLGEATGLLDRVQSKSHAIATNATEVRAATAETASSSLRTTAASDQLRETAASLADQVEASSRSLDLSTANIGRVARSTEALREVTDDLVRNIEAMAGSSRSVESEARDAAALSRRVHEVAEAGRSRVRGTIRGMEDIREASTRAALALERLQSRTGSIDSVLTVIRDIADETRLLGLNAAVIAAQAGDQGRGFSVVATEVRGLAHRVQRHTSEVSEMVTSIHTETSDLARAIEATVTHVHSGVELSTEAGASLDEITTAAGESGESVSRIVAEMLSQAEGAARLAEEMARVRGDVEQIETATREHERSTEALLAAQRGNEKASGQVRQSAEEEARAQERIRAEVEQVRTSIEQIDRALGAQADACRDGADRLRAVFESTQEGERAAQEMGEAMGSLIERAESLRREMDRFRLD